MKLFQSHPFRIFPASALLLALGNAIALHAENYTLFIYESEAGMASRTDASRGPAYWAAFADFGNKLKEAGVLRGGSALHAGDRAQTVTMRDGQTKVVAGAGAKAPLQLGGFFIIEVANLDTAIMWASRAPNLPAGTVEVHPAYPAPAM